MFSESLRHFIALFSQLPGIGQRSSERIGYFLLSQKEEFIKDLTESIINLKKNILLCSICGNLSEYDPCQICTNKSRDIELLCIVESPIDIYYIESTNCYKGLYHSLGGVLSPLNGITPKDLNINKLLDRFNSQNFRELIFATSPTTEGDATVLYIKDLLKDKNIIFSHLARGIPVGTSIQYAGNRSLSQAMKSREKLID